MGGPFYLCGSDGFFVSKKSVYQILKKLMVYSASYMKKYLVCKMIEKNVCSIDCNEEK